MLRKSIPVVSALALSISIAVHSGAAPADTNVTTNNFWWPAQLDLSALRQQQNFLG
ncbi:hypothetical protein [Cellvibrio sp. KY-GH-1]|uniref:hypothetical protein n=1 Tax=Cellvibrio sp. KY-GH-1 TaxID=2303332 RepID=UPI00177DABA0|nr:hypothetical protein [Cellvibrio sp. KY-GH-1]